MRSHLEFEWRAWMCRRMETPCPARRPCIIRDKSPVRHQSHHYRVNPWWKFPANSRWRRRRDGQSQTSKIQFKSPAGQFWLVSTIHDWMVPKIVHFLIAVQFACWMFYLPKDKRSVRPSFVYDTFSFQWPSQARNVRREPCDRDLSWPAKPTRLFLYQWRGVEKRAVWASARDDMVVDGHRTLCVCDGRVRMDERISARTKQSQQLERHVDDIISKCAHL